MYIKRVRKSNRNAKKSYEYLHLVENVRTVNGPRQRLIMNLGNISVAPEQYKELANCIDGMLTGQQELFSIDPKIEKLARKATDKIRDKQSAVQGIRMPTLAADQGVVSSFLCEIFMGQFFQERQVVPHFSQWF